jgi:hypothetical protein
MGYLARATKENRYNHLCHATIDMTNHENGRKTKYLTLGLTVVSDGLIVDLFILGDALLEILQGCFFVHVAKIRTIAGLELGVLSKKLFVVTDYSLQTPRQ